MNFLDIYTFLKLSFSVIITLSQKILQNFLIRGLHAGLKSVL